MQGPGVVVPLPRLDAFVDKAHQFLPALCIRLDQFDARRLEHVVVYPGAEGTVGGQQAHLSNVPPPGLLQTFPDHVQEGHVDKGQQPVVKGVGGVVGHDEKIRTHGLETDGAVYHFRQGIRAPVQQRQGPVGNGGVVVDEDMDVLPVRPGRGSRHDALEQIHRGHGPHAAKDADLFYY